MLMMMMTRMVLVSWHFAVLVLRVGGSLPVWRVEREHMLFCHEDMVAVFWGAFWKGTYRVMFVGCDVEAVVVVLHASRCCLRL